MSDKIPTSSRLDSLSRRSTPGTKPGLKFKPKVVARRSKEERDAEAPVTSSIDGNKNDKSARGNANRGRGGVRGGRGGRGGRALAGTHLVQAGPLASGNILSDTTQSFTRSATTSTTPDYLSHLVKRENGSRSASVGLDSDDEDDPAKINMSKEYKFDPEHTELFPVRPVRNEHVEPGDHKPSSANAAVERSESPESVTSASGSDSGLVKEEPQEKDLNTVLHEKDTELQKKLNDLQLQNEFLSVDLTEAKEETERLNKDHRSIVKAIIDADNNPERFLFVQLPRVLPKFEEDEVKATNAASEVEVKAESDGDVTMTKDKTSSTDEVDQLEGLVGKLRVHKSGKLTMKLGNVVMDVGKGSQTEFLQEVVLADEKENPNAYLLGHLKEKIVVTPRFA